MRYAFVSLSIVVIWASIIMAALAVPNFDVIIAHRIALLMTVILFIIGFRRKA